MSTIKQIKAPISNEIAQFNKEFISNIKTEKGILDKILKYINRFTYYIEINKILITNIVILIVQLKKVAIFLNFVVVNT